MELQTRGQLKSDKPSGEGNFHDGHAGRALETSVVDNLVVAIELANANILTSKCEAPLCVGNWAFSWIRTTC
jgi:hypothetical protein